MLLSRRLWRLYRFYNRLVYLDIFIRVSIKFIGTKIRIYSNKKKQSLSWLSICRGDRIRTCDPLLPKQIKLYFSIYIYLNVTKLNNSYL